jgi:hypothetical protein
METNIMDCVILQFSYDDDDDDDDDNDDCVPWLI